MGNQFTQHKVGFTGPALLKPSVQIQQPNISGAPRQMNSSSQRRPMAMVSGQSKVSMSNGTFLSRGAKSNMLSSQPKFGALSSAFNGQSSNIQNPSLRQPQFSRGSSYTTMAASNGFSGGSMSSRMVDSRLQTPNYRISGFQDHLRGYSRAGTTRMNAMKIDEMEQKSEDADPVIESSMAPVEVSGDELKAISEMELIKIEPPKLKEETYDEMDKFDSTKTIDPSLKLGTGDDELVDTIVKTAKVSMGGIGALIDDDVVTKAMKQKPKKNKEQVIEAKSFVSNARSQEQSQLMDKEGLPLVYSQEGIQQFWSAKSGELVGRWTEFLALASPFLFKLVTSFASGTFEQNQASLARDLRNVMEKLGPTYVKLGQMLSIRPDIIGDVAMKELKTLQDGVKKYPTSEALEVIKLEYGIDDISEVFLELSDEPVAAASLAQVYKGKLLDGTDVAVKVQRPGTLELVSKDLYVLRRASELVQGIVDRFNPTDRSDYIALMETWGEGFYTELDFVNEARNQIKFKELVADKSEGIYTPEVYMDYCRRRILVTEWVDGVKLTEAPEDEIADLIALGQDCFLDQLLEVGFFHCDPHPGNLIKMNDTSKGKICILDYGLMAEIPEKERKFMVAAIIHVGNKNFAALTDDYIALGFLPPDIDKSLVTPISERVLGPVVYNGGGANALRELAKDEASFQQITQDLLAAQKEIPFSIPPFIALLARAIAILEGLALSVDPRYKIVMEAYPFVTRKLLKDSSQDTQTLLREVMYDSQGRIQPQRFTVMMNSALNIVNKNTNSFIDLDTVPENGATLDQIVKFIISDKADVIKSLLIKECVEAGDLVLRESARRSFANVQRYSNLKPLFGLPGPTIKLPIPPVFLPGKGLREADEVVETLFPQPELKDEIYSQGLLELILTFVNLDASILDDPFQPEKYFSAVNSFVNNNRDSDNQEIVDLATVVIQNQSNTIYSQDEVSEIRIIVQDVLNQIQSKVEDRLQTI